MGTFILSDNTSEMNKGTRAFVRAGSALILGFVLSFFLFVGQAQAIELNNTDATTEGNRGFSWTFNSGTLAVSVPSDSTYSASFGDGDVDTSLVIPDSIDAAVVDKIVFSNLGESNTLIKSVQLPRTITSLTTSSGLKCFSCLETVRFSEQGAFALASVGYRSAKSSPFPSTLKQFNPQTIEVQGESMQIDCVVPDSVSSLAAYAFNGTSIENLYIPASVSSITANAFLNCNLLTTVVSFSPVWPKLPTSVTSMFMLGNVKEIANAALSGNTNLTEFTVAETVTSIGANAFSGCTSLESVKFGDTEALVSIGQSAFSGATSLKTLSIPDSVTFIGTGAFANCGIEAIVLPASLWEGMSLSEQGGDFNKDPAGTNISDTTGQGNHTAYGAQLFVNSGMSYLVNSDLWNTSLKSVDLSKYSQSAIPYYMFAGCSALEEVRIPASVRELKEGCFADCTSLTKVYLYNASPAVAGSASAEGEGSGGAGESGWIEHYPSAFGYHTYASSGAESFQTTEGTSSADTYAVKTDMTLYGVGFKQNELIAYAEKYGCGFIPFAFLGEGGSSQTVLDLFGYAMPANTVSVSSTVQPGETPTITLGYQDAEVSRTLIPGTDCTVTYTLNGVAVSDTYTPGVYTATITGDDDSVWGTTTATFSVEAPEGIDIPVSSTTGVTGVTASGSLYGSNIPDGGDCSVELIVDEVTEGETFEALKGSMGEGIFGGIFEVTLLINGEEVHDNFGTLTINFPVDAQYNGHWVTIYHLHSNGTISSERVLVQNGIAALTVSDLSTFGLEIGELANSSTNPDGNNVAANTTQASASTAADTLVKTGDSLPVMPLAVGGAVAFATSIVALVLLRRRLA